MNELERLRDLEAVIGEHLPDNETLDEALEVMGIPEARRQRLKELDAHITESLEVAGGVLSGVGEDLLEVRDRGLYLEFDEEMTFDRCCRERWGIDPKRADQLMDLALVRRVVGTAADSVPIGSERAGRELAPLLRAGGPEMVAEAWTAISDKFRGQRPPTGPEVRLLLVKLGYRPRPGQSVGGRTAAFAALGTVGDRISKLEQRVEGFFTYDTKKRKIGPDTRARAAEYAVRLEVVVARLRAFAEGE